MPETLQHRLEPFALLLEVARLVSLAAALQLGPDLRDGLVREAEFAQGVKDEPVGVVGPDPVAVSGPGSGSE